ncbi:Carbonate dehydratase [Paenibacillus curdlanolyticus YK9]|uniref:carbonic anhydrase n=1 Tax=Paenibacillus curdlanolyticus YK9 TaxID=717606 RepID=E0I512_9BACL|nr:carbonic anhydrase [Paenibacillus curdlanolyticus]EFM12054.1 Carbonate dehydratase [Paenibacillus curdlanolyticus YK9]
MTQLDQIIAYNEQFVQDKQYEPYKTDKFPNRKMVIVTCMDTRLTELLPKAMNIHNGDVKIIKNAGAIVTQPFGNIMRSVLVAIYELGADEVVVIGHHDCGMTGINPEKSVSKMVDRGVSGDTIKTLKNSGLDLMRWLRGFENVHQSVENSVNIIRNHPLLPPGTPVHGLIVHPETGKLEVVTEGYQALLAE